MSVLFQTERKCEYNNRKPWQVSERDYKPVDPTYTRYYLIITMVQQHGQVIEYPGLYSPLGWSIRMRNQNQSKPNHEVHNWAKGNGNLLPNYGAKVAKLKINKLPFFDFPNTPLLSK